MNLTKGIQKSLGPGILLAGAAIGGSHLLQIHSLGLGFINLKIKNNLRVDFSSEFVFLEMYYFWY